MASSERPKRLTGSARRAQLVDVGRAVFAERGYAAASIEEIAARARVSKPIVYGHFGGKEGLYAVVVDRETELVVGTITEAISAGSPRERLEKAAVAFLTYVRDNPEGFAVLSRDRPKESNGGVMTNLLSEVADRVGSIFADEFKRAGYDPKDGVIHAQALVGMVTFVGLWWTKTRKPSVEKVASQVAALAWMGLRHLPRKPELSVGVGR